MALLLLLLDVGLHALEDLDDRLLRVRNVGVLLDELAGILRHRVSNVTQTHAKGTQSRELAHKRTHQLVVGATRLDDLRLLLEGEVGPVEAGVDVLLVEGEDLIMGQGAGVREVVHALALLLGHVERHGQQVVKDL